MKITIAILTLLMFTSAANASFVFEIHAKDGFTSRPEETDCLIKKIAELQSFEKSSVVAKGAGFLETFYDFKESRITFEIYRGFNPPFGISVNMSADVNSDGKPEEFLAAFSLCESEQSPNSRTLKEIIADLMNDYVTSVASLEYFGFRASETAKAHFYSQLHVGDYFQFPQSSTAAIQKAYYPGCYIAPTAIVKLVSLNQQRDEAAIEVSNATNDSLSPKCERGKQITIRAQNLFKLNRLAPSLPAKLTPTAAPVIATPVPRTTPKPSLWETLKENITGF